MTKSIPGFFGAAGAIIGNRTASNCQTGQAFGFAVGTLLGTGVNYLFNTPIKTTSKRRRITKRR